MKKQFVALLLPLLVLSGCQGTTSSSMASSTTSSSSSEAPVVLAKVTGLTFKDGSLSFSAVDGAEGYKITITHLGESVFSSSVKATTLDVAALELEGTLIASVKAYKGTSEGEAATLEFTINAIFGDVLIEAEDNLLNFGTGKGTSNFRNNSLAHGGAYVGGIDDAGQGVYINYLCPKEGAFDFDAFYTTDMPTAYNDVWVNGVKQARLTYTEKTGWGGDTYNAAKATVQITLNKGWNTISIMKNGDESDTWGSYTELDYFVIHGDKSEYNPDSLASFGNKPATYRLEAEMGSPRKKSNDINTVKNPCIPEDGTNKYSNGFLMGGIESEYDGVEWHFYAQEKATYSVKAAYASGQDGSVLSFYVSQKAIGLTHDADFKDMTVSTIDGLENTGWNKVKTTTNSATITLESGDNFIYCLKSSTSGIYQLDYVDMSFVATL